MGSSGEVRGSRRGPILVCPLMALPCDLEAACAPLSKALGSEVRIEGLRLDLQPAYDADRDQYSSTRLLAALQPLIPRDVAHVAAVVDVDLYVPVLTFVFGEAQLGGPAAIVSMFRLREPWLADGVPDDLLQRRVGQTILHELGHSFGLHHCSDARCVMLSATSVEMLDEKSEALCFACAEALRSAER